MRSYAATPAGLVIPGGGSTSSRPSLPITGRVSQLKVAPPGHVGHVAERADHDQAGALGRVGQSVRQDRHLHAEQRRRAVEPKSARTARRRDAPRAPRRQAAAPAWSSPRRPRPGLRRRRENYPVPCRARSVCANASRMKVPGVSRSSISACATAVPNVTSHSAGASAW